MKIRISLISLILIVFCILLISCKKVSTIEFTVDTNACNGCGRCIQACPHDAIELNQEVKAVIDQTLCQQCGACVRVCPQNAIF